MLGPDSCCLEWELMKLSSSLVLDTLALEIHVHVLSRQWGSSFMQIHLLNIFWTSAALVFDIAVMDNLSGLLNESLQCHSEPQHTSLFKKSHPFSLSLTFPYDVSDRSERKTTLLLTFWFGLWRRMFFCESWRFRRQLAKLVYSPSISKPALSHSSTSLGQL